MKWFLIGYVTFAMSGDNMLGIPAPSLEIRIEMPSQEVCEQIRQLNRFSTLECWAKPESKGTSPQ